VGAAVEKVFTAIPVNCQVHVSKINPRGVHVVKG
jgi:hypothetical protein